MVAGPREPALTAQLLSVQCGESWGSSFNWESVVLSFHLETGSHIAQASLGLHSVAEDDPERLTLRRPPQECRYGRPVSP